jgi:DNA mismatch repair protein MutS2
MEPSVTPAGDGAESLQRCLEPLEWRAVQEMVRTRSATLLGEREADHLLPAADPLHVADERGRTVECLRLLDEAGRLPLATLKDPDPILKRLAVEGARLEGQDVHDLCHILRTADEVRKFVVEQSAAPGEEAAYPRLLSLALGLPDLSSILREVADHVSPSGQIQDSASPDLKKIRRRITHLSEKLQRELQQIIDKARSEIFLRDEYITVRNGRYVLPIRTDAPFPVPGVLHGRSSTGLTHFIEPMITVEINNEIVGLREREEEEIDRILRRYTRLLRDARGPVEETVAGVGRFDGIQARARLARDLKAIPAASAEDGGLRLEGARHPLLEASLRPLGREPVPIGMSLSESYPVLIVSGPNTGGKTVALKTVGLLVLMNQAGLLVPAEAASLPVFRRVLVDIGDHQSIAANLSTFSSHMQNIARMAEEAEPPALVLLDEIGTGTDPEEGAALGVAILRHFHRKGAFVMVTTHMSGIKSYGYETPGVKNACVEFDEQTLQPTFRLLLGVAGSSSGIEIARRLGLPDGIVADARDLMGPDSLRTDAYLKRVKETLEEVSRERERLAAQRREAERLRAREEAEGERREKERAREFREELAGAVERYEKALKQHLSGIDDKALRKKLEKEGRRKAANVEAHMEREVRDRFGGPHRPVYTPPSEVHPGDRVRIVSLGQKGTVDEVDGDRIRVDVGGKTLSCILAELALMERGQAGRAALPKRVSLDAGTKDSIGGELHLLGHSVDEALPKVDKFLDDAFLAGHTQVRLVHGHGTGALRRAIADFLKEHPHVANYRLASDGEGGTGVTVVDLRR